MVHFSLQLVYEAYFVPINICPLQTHWVCGFCPSSGILKIRKQHFGNWICFRPQARGGSHYSAWYLKNAGTDMKGKLGAINQKRTEGA
jgi:hypothetical protein